MLGYTIATGGAGMEAAMATSRVVAISSAVAGGVAGQIVANGLK